MPTRGEGGSAKETPQREEDGITLSFPFEKSEGRSLGEVMKDQETEKNDMKTKLNGRIEKLGLKSKSKGEREENP